MLPSNNLHSEYTTQSSTAPRFSDHVKADAFKPVALVPGAQLIAVEPMRLSAKGEGLQFDFDTVPVSQIAEGAQHHRTVSVARLKGPEPVNLDRPLGSNDQLNPSAAVTTGIEKCVSAFARRGRELHQILQKLLHAECHPMRRVAP